MRWDTTGKWISRVGPTVGLLLTATGLFLNLAQTAHSHKMEAADITLRFDDRLSSPTSAAIVSAAEDEPAMPIMKTNGGKFDEVDLDNVLGDFDTLYYLRKEGLLNDELAYDVFCPDLEAVHDNREVGAYLKADRRAAGAQDDYIGFDKLNAICLRWDKTGRGHSMAD